MAREVSAALRIKPTGSYIDCTVGDGGHAIGILDAVKPGPQLLGLDLDSEALMTAGKRLQAHGERVTLAHSNFADLLRLGNTHGFLPADGVLFDLGISSLQIETADRGFSFARRGRLDMRFDEQQELTAHHLVNKYTEHQLADIIFQFGEERGARRLARAIVRARPIDTTTDLAHVVARTVGRRRRGGIHPATRTFQALRIAVNRELDNVRAGLENGIQALASGGRLVAISYHSLEDRVVKNILRREASGCVCPSVTPECVCDHEASIELTTHRVVKPSPEELRTNPRSRSARMRVAERL